MKDLSNLLNGKNTANELAQKMIDDLAYQSTFSLEGHAAIFGGYVENPRQLLDYSTDLSAQWKNGLRLHYMNPDYLPLVVNKIIDLSQGMILVDTTGEMTNRYMPLLEKFSENKKISIYMPDGPIAKNAKNTLTLKPLDTQKVDALQTSVGRALLLGNGNGGCYLLEKNQVDTYNSRPNKKERYDANFPDIPKEERATTWQALFSKSKAIRYVNAINRERAAKWQELKDKYGENGITHYETEISFCDPKTAGIMLDRINSILKA